MFRRVRFTSSVLLKNNRSKIKGKPAGLPMSSEFANASKMPAPFAGGAERDRTDDLLLAKQALSQLSYSPFALRTAATPPRPSRLNGGSGWIRTIDPRLIKTVL